MRLPNFVWRLNRNFLFVNYLLVIVGLEIENYLLMIDDFEIVVIAKLFSVDRAQLLISLRDCDIYS